MTVTELVSGGDMRAEMARRVPRGSSRQLDEACIWSWFVQMARGVYALHQAGIVHRDLKTTNVFVAAEGADTRVKLGDMGVSKVVAPDQLTTTVVGTPYYLSPELWRRLPYDSKSDIWSLGCCLYELAALTHPFEGNDMDRCSADLARWFFLFRFVLFCFVLVFVFVLGEGGPNTMTPTKTRKKKKKKKKLTIYTIHPPNHPACRGRALPGGTSRSRAGTRTSCGR
jgi:serine/threonine protein kinase